MLCTEIDFIEKILHKFRYPYFGINGIYIITFLIYYRLIISYKNMFFILYKRNFTATLQIAYDKLDVSTFKNLTLQNTMNLCVSNSFRSLFFSSVNNCFI